jgi:hypothetical protein
MKFYVRVIFYGFEHDSIYTLLGSYPTDRRVLSRHFNVLLVAAYFSLYSYVEIHLRSEGGVREAGSPLLRCILNNINACLPVERSLDLAKFLLEKGCRPDCEFYSKTYWERLLACIHRKFSDQRKQSMAHDKVILLLLEFGADVNQRVDRYKHFQTSATSSKLLGLPEYVPPYRWYAYKDECSALQAMLQGCTGYTLLVPILKAILDRGADVTAVDSEGDSAIQVAEKNWGNTEHMPELKDLLTKYLPKSGPRLIADIESNILPYVEPQEPS